MWHTSAFPGAGSCDCYLCQPKIPLSAYLPRPAARAPRENAFYIVAVAGGTVLSKRPDGIFNKDAANSDTQRWRVEYGEEENHIALMNVSDGKWLRAFSGSSYGRVDTSEEKQWWMMEQGTSPGSCWIKCSDFADAYLYNANGSFVDGNAAFTKPKQHDREHASTWTLRDADAVGYDAQGWNINVSSSSKAKSLELEKREQMITEKEKSLLEKERQLNARIEEQGVNDDRISSREAELIKLSDDLSAKEVALQKRAEDLASSQAELKRIHGSSKEVAMLKAENDNLHLQLRTFSLEREVEKVKQRSASLSHSEQLRDLDVERARLRVLLHAEKEKARNSPSPVKSTSVFSSPSYLATRAVKDPRTLTPARTSSRPHSSSGIVSKSTNGSHSHTVTPNSTLRHTKNDPRPSTPTPTSKGMITSGSNTQRSYDSRFSGWPEDDVYEPTTPMKSSKRAPPFGLGLSTPSADKHDLVSKEGLLSPTFSSRRDVDSQMRGPEPGSFVSQNRSVSSTGGKATSKSTPARAHPPRMTALKYGAPEGMLPLHDDGDALLYACGHKVFKPPRKLNKTVVGYLYE